ncbi:MAG: histone deacetylase [Armatimonadetes bacterium]|nr:histone deacetylase [Armatimonadota bacterium]
MTVALITHPDYVNHLTGQAHPERPDRMRAIAARLEESGLADDLVPITPEPVEPDDLERVHRREYIDHVKTLAATGGGLLDPDTMVSSRSEEVARLSAGGAVAAVSAVMNGPHRAAFAVIRPPGHHALPAHGMGFCLFNNIAIAAASAREQLGLSRICIVDWDVHHGNGTQEIFYRDRSVLFISTHQEHWYPGTGAAAEIGEGEGEGFTVNIPLPAGTGDEGYRLVFEEIILPVVDVLAPQLILVSAGYDAHFADPLGGMVLTAAGFRTLARLLVAAAERHNSHLAAVLEGGYSLSHLGHSVVATLEAFTGRTARGGETDEPPEELPYSELTPRVRAVRKIVRDSWNI